MNRNLGFDLESPMNLIPSISNDTLQVVELITGVKSVSESVQSYWLVTVSRNGEYHV